MITGIRRRCRCRRRHYVSVINCRVIKYRVIKCLYTITFISNFFYKRTTDFSRLIVRWKDRPVWVVEAGSFLFLSLTVPDSRERLRLPPVSLKTKFKRRIWEIKSLKTTTTTALKHKGRKNPLSDPGQ